MGAVSWWRSRRAARAGAERRAQEGASTPPRLSLHQIHQQQAHAGAVAEIKRNQMPEAIDLAARQMVESLEKRIADAKREFAKQGHHYSPFEEPGSQQFRFSLTTQELPFSDYLSQGEVARELGNNRAAQERFCAKLTELVDRSPPESFLRNAAFDIHLAPYRDGAVLDFRLVPFQEGARERIRPLAPARHSRAIGDLLGLVPSATPAEHRGQSVQEFE